MISWVLSDKVRHTVDGQASVEVACLLPTLLIVLTLLLQPVCLLYPRILMYYAAGDVGRMAATSLQQPAGSQMAERLNQLVRTRLTGVIPCSLFHVGDAQSWDVSISVQERVEGAGGQAEVHIGHRVKPIPLFAPLLETLGRLDGEGALYQEVTTRVSLRPEWDDQ